MNPLLQAITNDWVALNAAAANKLVTVSALQSAEAAASTSLASLNAAVMGGNVQQIQTALTAYLAANSALMMAEMNDEMASRTLEAALAQLQADAMAIANQ